LGRFFICSSAKEQIMKTERGSRDYFIIKADPGWYVNHFDNYDNMKPHPK
jgi:hypothetical protein